MAIFWPYGPYPIKEDGLRQFEIQDRLKDLPIRVTKAGEKIGGSGRPVTVISKPKSKTIQLTPALSQAAPVPQPTASLPPKSGVNGTTEKATETKNPDPIASPTTTPQQNAPPK